MVKGDAPIFCAAVPADYEATVEVTCVYEPKEQFDQVCCCFSNREYLHALSLCMLFPF